MVDMFRYQFWFSLHDKFYVSHESNVLRPKLFETSYSSYMQCVQMFQISGVYNGIWNISIYCCKILCNECRSLNPLWLSNPENISNESAKVNVT